MMLDINIEKYRRHIKKSCSIDDSIQNIHTPYDLCRDVISKLKENIDLTDKNINILVLFNLEFVLTLMEDYGVNEENITFLSDSRMRNVVAERMGVKTEYLEDFKSIKEGKNIMGKQFGVVIGNPPYQMPKERKTNELRGLMGPALWTIFVEFSIKNCCREGGYTCLIHPGQWRKPEHELLSLIKKFDLIYLEMHSIKDGIKHFKVATGYDWHILRKKGYKGLTKIKDINGEIIDITIKDLDFIPNCNFNLIQSLVAKDGEEKAEIIFDSSYHTQTRTEKGCMSDKKTEEFKFPCVYGLQQKRGLVLRYSNTNSRGHFGIKKVIIPLSLYTDAYVDHEGEYGICQFTFGIKIPDRETGEKIREAIRSEKFKKIWKAAEWIYNGKEWRVFKLFRKDFWKEFI